MQHKPNSIFSAASSILSESRVEDPAIQKLIDAQAVKAQKLTDAFYAKEDAMSKIKEKAKQEIAVHREEQKKVTAASIKMIDEFSVKMASLGYEFRPLGGWRKK